MNQDNYKRGLAAMAKGLAAMADIPSYYISDCADAAERVAGPGSQIGTGSRSITVRNKNIADVTIDLATMTPQVRWYVHANHFGQSWLQGIMDAVKSVARPF